MNIWSAFKAFWKALQEPQKAQQFLEDKPKQAENTDLSHLRLLSILQQSGRLIDFLKEDISSYTDEQVGGAVRKIHQDCNKSLEELIAIRPLMDENEGALIKIVQGYDPATIKIVGKVKGEPPFTGILVHKGWKASKRSLPKKVGDTSHEVLHPAEIEVR